MTRIGTRGRFAQRYAAARAVARRRGGRAVPFYDAECVPCECPATDVRWVPTKIVIRRSLRGVVVLECFGCGTRWEPPHGRPWYRASEARVLRVGRAAATIRCGRRK